MDKHKIYVNQSEYDLIEKLNQPASCGDYLRILGEQRTLDIITCSHHELKLEVVLDKEKAKGYVEIY